MTTAAANASGQSAPVRKSAARVKTGNDAASVRPTEVPWVFAMYESPPHDAHFVGSAADDHALACMRIVSALQCGQRAIFVRSNDPVERPTTVPAPHRRARNPLRARCGHIARTTAPMRC